MADRLSVNLDGLRTAAGQILGHSDDFHVDHVKTNTRVSAASAGWAGRSAAALSGFTAALQERSAVLAERMSDHSRKMVDAAEAYPANDEQQAEELAQLGGNDSVYRH